MRSLGLLSLALLAPLLAACGGGEDEPGATFTSSPNQSASPTEEAEVASDDCKVAAVTWADRATDHVLTMTTTAPAFGEPEDLADLDDVISQISVICPPAVDDAVAAAMDPMTQANFELTLCSFDAMCDAPTAKEVRRLADRAASSLGFVRLSVGEAG